MKKTTKKSKEETKTCKTCQGSGSVLYNDEYADGHVGKCPECRGRGKTGPMIKKTAKCPFCDGCGKYTYYE